MNKYVIMADKQVGKTTLVNKIIKHRQNNICGFFTERFLDLVDEEGFYPIYMRGINESRKFDDEHLIGKCKEGMHYTNNEVFNNLGVNLISTNNPNDLIIMDEVGFLEMNAEKFKNKLVEVLASDNEVLLMLKQRLDVSFLKDIQENKNVEFIRMNLDNRDIIYEYLLEKLL